MHDLPPDTILEVGGTRGEALHVEVSQGEVHLTLLTDEGMVVKSLAESAFRDLLKPLDHLDADQLLLESSSGDQDAPSSESGPDSQASASRPREDPDPHTRQSTDEAPPLELPDATESDQKGKLNSSLETESEQTDRVEEDRDRASQEAVPEGAAPAQEALSETAEDPAPERAGDPEPPQESSEPQDASEPEDPTHARPEERSDIHEKEFSPSTSSDEQDPELTPKPASAILVSSLSPRGYQQEAIDAWREEGGVGMLNMATGTGKTLTALFAMGQLWPDVRTAVVACPTKILVEQWRDEIRRVFPEAAIFVHGDTDAWRQAGPLPDGPTFLIGTYHGLYRREFADWYNAHMEPSQTALLLDEVHRAGSEKYSNVLDFPAAYRLGLSATPRRDWDIRGNQRLEAALRGEVYHFGLGEAIQKEFLSPYTYHLHIVPLTPEEREGYAEISVKIQNILQALGYDPEKDELPAFLQRLEDQGDERAEIVRQLLINRTVYHKEAFGKEAYLHDILNAHDFERCLVYCNTQRHVDRYRRALQKAGKSVAFYTSKVGDDQRRQALRAFEKGHIDFLISIRCLDEGVDIPTCESAIIASSSTTTREFIQRRGRLLRTSPNKAQAAIHDLLVLPVDPETSQTEIPSWEASLIKKELRRAYIFNEQALNRSENETFLGDLAAALEIPFPGDIADDINLESRLEIWNQDLNQTEWGEDVAADVGA